MVEYCDVGPSCYSTAEYRARKEYRCCECKAPIHVGEKYLYCFGVWEGEASTFRQHMLCAEACEFFRDKINDGDCLPFGGLLDEGRDYFAYMDRDRKQRTEAATWRKMLAGIYRRMREAAAKRQEGNHGK